MKNKLKLLSILFFTGLSLFACNLNQGILPKETKDIRINQSGIQELLEQYGLDNQYDYDPSTYVIKNNQPILIDSKRKTDQEFGVFTDFERPSHLDETQSHYPFKVYSDFTLSDDLSLFYKYKRTGNQFKIYPAYQVEATKHTEYNDISKSDFSIIDERDWGIYDQLYLVLYNDMKTGKLLEKPLVKTYIIEKQKALDSPIVSYEIGKNGSLHLTWTPVEGATKYYVLCMEYEPSYNKEELKAHPQIVGETTQTSWSSYDEGLLSEEKNDFNYMFEHLGIPNDDILLEEATNYQVVNLEKNIDPSYLVIVASNETQKSPQSNRLYFKEFADKIPVGFAYNTYFKDDINLHKVNIHKLPQFLPVIMASGRVKYLPIVLNIEDSQMTKNNNLDISYHIKGTPIVDTMTIYQPGSDYEEHLKSFNEKARKFSVSGSLPTLNIEKVVEDINAEIANSLPDISDSVFGTTDLSYYIAANLINNAEVIDLSSLGRNISDGELYDALWEAIFQNSLIPYIRSYKLSKDNRFLSITYGEENKDIRIQQQKEIRDTLDRAVEDIRQQSSQPIEQLKLVNQYLCLVGDYDWEAYQSQPTFENNEYPLSYHTYGIPVQHKGVCISYALAFNYMARALDLESVLVTGVINGSSDAGHAWNAIKLDGRWLYFDATWNDKGGDIYTEDYFGLPMEDSIFHQSHSLDYYFITDQYFDQFTNQ